VKYNVFQLASFNVDVLGCNDNGPTVNKKYLQEIQVNVEAKDINELLIKFDAHIGTVVVDEYKEACIFSAVGWTKIEIVGQ